MARFFPLRRSLSPFFTSPAIVSRACRFCSQDVNVEEENELRAPITPNKFYPFSGRGHGIQLPPLIPSGSNRFEGFNIEIVDNDLWNLSLGTAQASYGSDEMSESPSSLTEKEDGARNGPRTVEEFPDFDDIEDLRLHKKLFFKLDKGSKEFEECDVNFHRTKSWKKRQEKLMQADPKKESKKSQKPSSKPPSCRNSNLVTPKGIASLQGRERSRTERGAMSREAPSVESKKARTLTFNQLTDPYHLPFCLDIYVSKGSVRACIVHRATSKVVTVAHSISKDMKFDLASRKDSTACAAVGKVLAQRAIEDDIHNAVYTPRKGDRIEGKIQIVLESIISHGIDVKVKLKQKRPVKVSSHVVTSLLNQMSQDQQARV